MNHNTLYDAIVKQLREIETNVYEIAWTYKDVPESYVLTGMQLTKVVDDIINEYPAVSSYRESFHALNKNENALQIPGFPSFAKRTNLYPCDYEEYQQIRKEMLDLKSTTDIKPRLNILGNNPMNNLGQDTNRSGLMRKNITDRFYRTRADFVSNKQPEQIRKEMVSSLMKDAVHTFQNNQYAYGVMAEYAIRTK